MYLIITYISYISKQSRIFKARGPAVIKTVQILVYDDCKSHQLLVHRASEASLFYIWKLPEWKINQLLIS